MATTISILPPYEIRLILEWVNEPKNAAVCKSWRAATKQHVAMLTNGDQGYFHSKILRPFLPSSAPPSTYSKQMRFMAEVIKNVRVYCELTPNTAPPILSEHKPIETAVLENIVTRVSAPRSARDLIKFMSEINGELPRSKRFCPTSFDLTNAQTADEIRLFFQNHQPAIQAIARLNSWNYNLFSLPPEIGQFFNLRLLNVSSNRHTTIPPEIRHLVNLQTLIISTNHLITLSPEIGHLINLQYLNVFHNNLTTLPPEIGRLVNLQRLDVAHNHLTTLPPEIGHFVNLQELYVQNNHLFTLPPEIRHLVNLQVLTGSHNHLTVLPPEIGRLVNLQYLDVSHNNLLIPFPEIGHLANLQWLHVSNNRLTTLPHEIGRLVNLHWLRVSNNRLTTLPPEIGRLNHLSLLDLSNNPAIANTQTGRNQTLSTRHQSSTEWVIKMFRADHPNCQINL